MLGVCYYPEHWPEDWWAEDAAAMRRLGIALVRIGEFSWSRLEPEPGRLEWGWLDRALDVLGGAGLRVILGTPTATPPKWLSDAHPDILPVGADGRTRGFGSRRHTTFSSETWWRESRRIVAAMADRYGTHAAVAGWQIDNEFGCHDTVASYGEEDLAEFRSWLERRHGAGDAIDRAWGNVFWSMELGTPGRASLPSGAVTEANPAARLDWWRFGSDQVAAYGGMQEEILRARSPGRFVTHNFMGRFLEFDHWNVASTLDLATWDSYPLGFTQQFPCEPAERADYSDTGLPDMSGFHHDLYRGVGRGRFAVMEQQAGPVNWAPWNPVPRRGMVRLWTWEALAHGAEFVSFFRWRQAPFAQEQMHSGLQRPDQAFSAGGREVETVGRELASLGGLPPAGRAPVALLVDYPGMAAIRIQPQGADYEPFELVLRWYEAVRRLGFDVDVVRPGDALEGYRLVLAPVLPIVDAATLAALAATDAVTVFGPRTFSKTVQHAIPSDLPPGPLAALLGIRVTEVASLPPGLAVPVGGAVEGTAGRWREWIETASGAEIVDTVARFADGEPAVLRAGARFYVAFWPDAAARDGIVRLAADRAGVAVKDLPRGVRLRRRGDLRFVFNYGPDAYTVPALPRGAAFVLGGATVAPGDLACWRDDGAQPAAG